MNFFDYFGFNWIEWQKRIMVERPAPKLESDIPNVSQPSCLNDSTCIAATAKLLNLLN